MTSKRITSKHLRQLVADLNEILHYPDDPVIGHIQLDANSVGCQLEQISTSNGGTVALSPILSVREMYYYLKGMDKYSHLLQERWG